LISVPGCSLSAGQAVSHIRTFHVKCLTCPPVPLESRTLHSNQLSKKKKIRIESNNLLEHGFSAEAEYFQCSTQSRTPRTEINLFQKPFQQ
jgi:hypothetical protein